MVLLLISVLIFFTTLMLITDEKLWENAYLKYYFLQHGGGKLCQLDLAIVKRFSDLRSVNGCAEWMVKIRDGLSDFDDAEV